MMFMLIYTSPLADNMTSPSMKSTEKKTPEKRRSTSESSEAAAAAEHVHEEPPKLEGTLNAFAWMRIFRFSTLLVRQG